MLRRKEIKKLIKNYPPKVRELISCFACKCGFGRVTMIENIFDDERCFYMQISLLLYYNCYRYSSLEPDIQQLNKSLERLIRLKTDSATRAKAKVLGIYDISALEASIRGMVFDNYDYDAEQPFFNMVIKISCDENANVIIEKAQIKGDEKG